MGGYQFFLLLIFFYEIQYKYDLHPHILLDIIVIMKILLWKWASSHFWLQKYSFCWIFIFDILNIGKTFSLFAV